MQLRGAMSDLAERTKADLLQVLGQRDEWKTPLVINLDFPQANLPELVPARFDFSQTGSGLKLQLNLLVTNDLQGDEVRRELLRAILIEMIYRSRSAVAAGSRYVAPPDWLVDGLLQLAPGHDTDSSVRSARVDGLQRPDHAGGRNRAAKTGAARPALAPNA